MSKTVYEFIKELNRISDNKKTLPILIKAPNGELTYPNYKMIINKTDKGYECESIIITHE